MILCLGAYSGERNRRFRSIVTAAQQSGEKEASSETTNRQRHGAGENALSRVDNRRAGMAV
jgi:hypothetical protein